MPLLPEIFRLAFDRLPFAALRDLTFSLATDFLAADRNRFSRTRKLPFSAPFRAMPRLMKRLSAFRTVRTFTAALVAVMLLSVSERSASAQELLAQTGTAKTAIGWAIVVLCVGLGLLVICRPGTRGLAAGKKKKK